ncbi:class A beta-lactamase-related serine hydrolase [Paenibacillus oralis]|uniref:Class A beta-lactamase-related serine hydrolase n=1 Tax=Paenibacillus oralis TaxID=2490856 RepID=A0A3P3U5B1_9BACL|nr:serine hydrolase domain-containing protein [Paenibacillus oralis]RRJ64906.1 class A beta-lactamase-related serine hydrolase [Paenibacillus oralis]
MKRHCALIALLVLVMDAWGASFPGVAAADERLSAARLEQTLDAVINEAMAKDHIPGVAIVVTMEERIIYKKGYGYADIKRKIPVDPDQTVMPVGSLTKSLTATAIMQLKEQNKLSLEEDVNSYLTSVKIPLYRQQPITLQHLLTHTAGLDEALYGTTAVSPAKTIPLGEFLERYFGQQPPVRPPGKEYAYSNAGLGLAAYVLEEVTGSTLNDYLSRNLFEPLDMPSAALNAAESPDMARSYLYRNGEYKQLPYSCVNLPGAGGLSVVPTEWAHYMIAHLNEGKYQNKRMLSPGSVAEMHARHFTEHPDLEGVGYGFFRTRLKNGLLTLSHTGDVDGFSAKMELIPAHKIGILVISNASSPGIPLRDKVTSAVTGLLPETGNPAAQPGVTSADHLRQYERTYTMNLGPQHGSGKWFRWLGAKDYQVQSSGKALVIKGVFPEGSGEIESRTYIPLSRGLFQDQSSGDTLSFHQENGSWKLAFTQGVTIAEKPAWWRHPSTAFAVYAAVGLFWIFLFITGSFRCLLRFILRKKQALPGPVAWIATLFTVYLIGQLLYGNSEVFTQGYPVWYAWGFSSLPLLALAGAIVLGVRTFSAQKSSTGQKRRLQTFFSAATCLICLFYTIFLFYWNMLSIHYS